MPYVYFGSFWIVIIFAYSFCTIFCSNITVLLSSWTMFRSVILLPSLISHSYCSFWTQISPFKHFFVSCPSASVIHISHFSQFVVTSPCLASSILLHSGKFLHFFNKSKQEQIWIRMIFFQFVAAIPTVLFYWFRDFTNHPKLQGLI